MYHAPPQLRIINFFYNEDRYEKMLCVDYVKLRKFHITFYYTIYKNSLTIDLQWLMKIFQYFS